MINGQIIEKLTIDLLYELGYNQNYTERQKGEISGIILGDLIEAIKKINPSVNGKQIQEVIKKIENNTLKNKDFNKYLQEGIQVCNREKNVRIIDFENIENNTFQVSNEYIINNMCLDIVIFINGLPLAVIELKRNENMLESAYNQLKKYQEKLSLFKYNQFMIVSNGKKAKVGTITNSWNEFREWKQIDSDDKIELNLNTYQTLFRGMFRKDRILDIINNFIIWDGEQKKIVTYHQYFGIKKAIESTKVAVENQTRRAGIYYQTIGSGTTQTSIFYTKYLLKDYKSADVLILTDRKEIKKQEFYKYSSCFENSNIKLEDIENNSDIQKVKNEKCQKIIFATIQQIEQQQEPITLRDDIFIIINDSIINIPKEENLKKIKELFPNATFFGITTCLSQQKGKNTRDLFGDVIYKYDGLQSVKDYSMLPIVYERVQAMNIMGNIDYYDMRLIALLQSKSRIEKIVEHIISHYEKIQYSASNKAMIVTHSIETANNIYDKIMELKPEWNNKVQKIVSTRNPKEIRMLEEEFKDRSSEFKIAIVVDMWITGIEVQDLGVIYIDKKMGQHQLMQVISRVNRTYKNKKAGLIVDYFGIEEHLDKLANNVIVLRCDDVKESIIEKIDFIKKIFNQFCDLSNLEKMEFENYEIIKNGAEFVLKNNNRKNKFMKNTDEIKNLYPLCAEILEKDIVSEIEFFVAIRSFILKISNKEMDLNEINYMKAKTLEDKIIEISDIQERDNRITYAQVYYREYKKRNERIK